jgi:hypothetical protein
LWALSHNLLLGVSVLAVGDFSLRLASCAVPGGLMRVLAAAPVAGATIVLWALGLGLVSLGTSPIALTLGALATAAAGRLWLPTPDTPLSTELSLWWTALPRTYRLVLCAVLGVAAVQLVWMWRHPWIGEDGLGYHLPDALVWVRNGRPGSQHEVLPLIPVQNYAMTYEVMLSWLLGISRGFSILAPLQLAFGALLISAWVGGLAAIGVPRRVRWLAAAAATSLPMVIEQFNSVANDLPTTVWAVVAAALCAGAPRHPRLLAPAFLAAALSVGTKSTAAIALAVALTLGCMAVHRAGRRFPVKPVAVAVLAGVAVGGVWYVRDLFQHGSPLWPLVAAPWGTPKPYFLTLFDRSFIAVPGPTLAKTWPMYRAEISGGLVLMAAVLPALFSRQRRVRASAAIACLLVAVWASAPYTGITNRPVLNLLPGSTIRYIMPALMVCILTVALAAGTGSRTRRERLAVAALAVAVPWSLYQIVIAWGVPYTGSVRLLAAGSLGGILLGEGVRYAARVRATAARIRPAALALGTLAVFAAFTPAAIGFVARHGRVNYVDGALVRWFASRPGFDSSSQPVAMSPGVNAMLAGDRLTHPLYLVSASEGCPHILSRARRGWVVIRTTIFEQFTALAVAVGHCVGPHLRPLAVTPPDYVYGPD